MYKNWVPIQKVVSQTNTFYSLFYLKRYTKISFVVAVVWLFLEKFNYVKGKVALLGYGIVMLWIIIDFLITDIDSRIQNRATVITWALIFGFLPAALFCLLPFIHEYAYFINLHNLYRSWVGAAKITIIALMFFILGTSFIAPRIMVKKITFYYYRRINSKVIIFCFFFSILVIIIRFFSPISKYYNLLSTITLITPLMLLWNSFYTNRIRSLSYRIIAYSLAGVNGLVGMATGQRVALIIAFFPLIFLELRGKRLNVKKAIIYIIFLSLTLTVVLPWVNTIRTLHNKGKGDIDSYINRYNIIDYLTYDIKNIIDGFRWLILRTSYIDTLAVIYSTTPSQIPYLHGKTYIRIPVFLVPRRLMPSKPTYSSGAEFAYEYFGWNIRMYIGGKTAAVGPSIHGEAYANFGYFGVIAVLFIVGSLYRYIDILLLRLENRYVYTYLLLICAGTQLINLEQCIDYLFVITKLKFFIFAIPCILIDKFSMKKYGRLLTKYRIDVVPFKIAPIVKTTKWSK